MQQTIKLNPLKFLKILFLLWTPLTPNTTLAQVAPETVYIDATDTSPIERIVPVSNSVINGEMILQFSGEGPAHGTLVCNNKVLRSFRLGHSIDYRKQKPRHRTRRSIQLSIPKNDNTCKIKFGRLRPLRLVNDRKYSKVYNAYTDYTESCFYEESDVFFSNEYPHMSCVHPLENIEILSESKDSLLKKLEVILGYKPTIDLINDQNPYAELDFSQAPQLDAIFISTLLYQNDFTGQLISRILKFHASRGTVVNIVGTGYMHSDKAKSLFKELTRFSPNIRVQEYKYYEDEFSNKFNLLTNFLRDMHIKLLVTLSQKEPQNNVVILGGRNIHDGFLFNDHPDLLNYPELDQVDKDIPFAYWQDVEFKIQSQKLAESSYAQLLRFWNRDLKTTEMVPIHTAPTKGEITKVTGGPTVRQIVSLPFSDNMALEKLYVEMIDRADHSIVISSPYLRPTLPIMEALRRAIARNVEISIQTRIDLEGDTQDWLYEETNKAAINELYQKVKIFEWTKKSILHSKLLVIDDDLSFIGSVNLSRRSFIQDGENGMMIHSRAFNQSLRSLIGYYQSSSRVITNEQKRNFWAALIVNLFQNQF